MVTCCRATSRPNGTRMSDWGGLQGLPSIGYDSIPPWTRPSAVWVTGARLWVFTGHGLVVELPPAVAPPVARPPDDANWNTTQARSAMTSTPTTMPIHGPMRLFWVCWV